MPEQIYIGNFAKGLKSDRTAFNIDNDAFPTLFNAHTWRGRVQRKRGTQFLGQLRRQIQSVAVPANVWEYGPLVLVAGAGNLLTYAWTQGPSATAAPLESATGSIAPGTLSLVVGLNTYTEPSVPDGTLVGTPAGSGTISYATGAITIAGGAGSNVTGTFSYYPGLPVLGLRDFVVNGSNILYPVLLAFDDSYSYQINQTLSPPEFYSVNYYKTSNNPFIWNGADYQQFWTVNYASALWATNNVPGLHIQAISAIATGAITTITTGSAHKLVTGDYVWFNEITGANASLLNLKTAQVTVTGPTTFTVPINTALAVINNSGIFQKLTQSMTGQDGIKWYDGDPTTGTGIPTVTGLGWVNFAPPLTAATVSIDNNPLGLYYLVGALAIVPFKDRILFFSPWISTSAGPPIQLQDTVIWSWNGTPYYTTVTPNSETNDPTAFYVDQTGKGGWLSAGISQPIATVSTNEDVLLVGFGGRGRKTRFVYTGNDLNPFLFFTINSELPSSCTFSTITLDKGAIDIGPYGIALTDQQSAQRIDLDIPDSVFQIQAQNNGAQRVNAIRDFFREWIYFSYPLNNSPWKFPTQSFLFNYRDNTWAILYENFTAHGNYRRQSKKSWLTTGFKSWNAWNQPWNTGSGSPLFTNIIGGNPQGYVLIKDQGTGEGISGTISAIANSSGITQITSPNHCVRVGDYLYFSGAISTTTSTITNITQATQAVITSVNTYLAGQYILIDNVAGMTSINGKFVRIVSATGTTITIDLDTTLYSAYISGGNTTFSPLQNQIGSVVSIIDLNNFVVDLLFVSATYFGLGKFTRLSQPLIQTKQFPVYWEQGRQCRLSSQKYLMETTDTGQVTINVYLSQDIEDAWNDPTLNVPPNSLVYTQLMYTCPESSNIGLTPANTNLQMPIADDQQQIWHRFNTSLIGDSIQIGITLSDAQMRNLIYATSEIMLHGMHLVVDKAGQLA